MATEPTPSSSMSEAEALERIGYLTHRINDLTQRGISDEARSALIAKLDNTISLASSRFGWNWPS